MNLPSWRLPAAFAGTLAFACSAVGQQEPAASAAAGAAAQSASDLPAVIEPARLPSADPGLQKAVDAALADAARRYGGDKASPSVVSTEAVVWPDGSLGCPEPGVVYTMAQVPGYRIRIRSGERLLEYHAGRRGNVVLCPAGRSTAPLPGASM
jgi:hypothetical protein